MARPRKADQIDIAARAVEAALEICLSGAADRLTLGAVGRAIGCSAPALYRYFPSREALLLAVHDEGFRRLFAAKRAAGAAAGDDPLLRLRLGGLAYVAFAFDNPALYELMFMDRGPYHRLVELAAAGHDASDHARRSLEFLRSSITAVQQQGYLGGLSPDAAAFTFWSAVHGAIALALRRRAPFPAEGRTAAEAAVITMMDLVAASKS